jgi:dihydroorotate dehydrogenase
LKLALFLLKILPEELAHSLALNGLKLLDKTGLLKLIVKNIKNNEIDFLGMKLKNNLGTAAGLDKNGDFINSLGRLGFGFLEVGTVTPLPQSGNAKPRLFRIFRENAIINRMGFNNKGVDHLVKNLKTHKYKGIVGVNIGANKTSQGEQRIEDYLVCFKKVYEYADYIVVNISSPNTKNLRELHYADNLNMLLSAISQLSSELQNTSPIFLKISPDENDESLKKIVEMVKSSIFSGLIATNTTVDKSMLKQSKYHNFEGGLSGAPLFNKSNQKLELINTIAEDMPLIAVGGVINKETYTQKLESGADLVQIYTGFIIKGPSIVNEILN